MGVNNEGSWDEEVILVYPGWPIISQMFLKSGEEEARVMHYEDLTLLCWL